MYIIIYIYVIIPICPYFFSALNSAWANFRQRTGHRDPRATNAGPWEVQVLLLAAGRNWGKPHETRGKLIGCRQVGWSEGNCGEQSESWDHDVLGSTECATALRRLFIAMHVDRLTSLMFPSTWIDQIPNRCLFVGKSDLRHSEAAMCADVWPLLCFPESLGGTCHSHQVFAHVTYMYIWLKKLCHGIDV